MNPAALFAAHRTAILGGAAAAVAGVALLNKRKNAGSATAGATVPGTIPASAVVPDGGSIGGAYDSTSYDLYNALQPELEQLRQTQGQPVGPVPAPQHTSPLYKDGYFRVAGSNATYHQDTHGNLDWISKAEGDALQLRKGEKNAGKIQTVAKDSTFWNNRKYLDKAGNGAPKTPGTAKK